MRTGSIRQIRTLSVWLLLAVALLMRAVVPVGYMAEESNGRITIAICHSDSVLQIPLKNKERGDRDAKSRDHPACAFGSLAGGGLAPDLATIPPRLNRDTSLIATALAFRLSGAERLTPPSTGPPLPA